MTSAERLLLLADGRCIGCFREQTKERGSKSDYSVSKLTGLLLEASGARFNVIQHDGSIQRHMTRFPLSTMSAMLRCVLDFRNRHSTQPYLAPCFHKAQVDLRVSIRIVSLVFMP
jgi:hypothetical protein